MELELEPGPSPHEGLPEPAAGADTRPLARWWGERGREVRPGCQVPCSTHPRCLGFMLCLPRTPGFCA